MKNNILTYLLIAIAYIVSTGELHAQISDSLSIEEELAPSISLNPSGDAEKKKKEKKEKEAKPPKGVFYGIPAKKSS